MHFLFSDYRVKNLPKQDGHTEFFKLDCLNNLLNILKSLKNFKDLSIVKGIQLTKIILDLKPKFDRNLSFSILSQKEISGQFFSYFFDFAVLLGEVTSKNCIKSYSSSTLCFLLIVFVF